MQMRKERNFKEVSFLSCKIGDISALQAECYSLHRQAHKDTVSQVFCTFQMSSLVRVEHYEFRCSCFRFLLLEQI